METNNYLYYVTDKQVHFKYWANQMRLKCQQEKVPLNIHWLKRIDPESPFSFKGLQIRPEQVTFDPKMRCSWEFFSEFSALLWRTRAMMEFDRTSEKLKP